MATLVTTLGPKSFDELGTILPHEHVFVDLRTPDTPGYAEAETADVVRVMAPQIDKAREAGVTAIVEPSTVGVGRRADILKALSEATGFPLVVPTGVYREPWIPNWAHASSEAALREWMIGELTGEIEASGVRAGWIKVSAGDDGITATETKILRAAAGTAAVNAAIGSHTIRGRVVRDQLDIIEEAGYPPERFVWIHAHLEPDFGLNLELARRGAWIEYDVSATAARTTGFSSSASCAYWTPASATGCSSARTAAGTTPPRVAEATRGLTRTLARRSCRSCGMPAWTTRRSGGSSPLTPSGPSLVSRRENGRPSDPELPSATDVRLVDSPHPPWRGSRWLRA